MSETFGDPLESSPFCDFIKTDNSLEIPDTVIIVIYSYAA